MSIYSITNRYASALLRQAEDKNQFDKISEDMQLVHDTISGSKELRVVLESPIITEAKKLNVLKDIFSDKIEKESENFLSLVVDKKRADMLFPITKRFLELRDKKLNIVPASITTAVELSDTDREQFHKSLEDYTGKKIRASYSIDDKIIGGFLVKIQDKMLDASVRQQLKLLKKRLVKSDQTLVN